MDDLLGEFLTETGENLDVVDLELVRFEREPNNTAILEDIFRLVHTIKGTCGFLGLPRLEALTHAAESLMAQFRAGAVSAWMWSVPTSTASAAASMSTRSTAPEPVFDSDTAHACHRFSVDRCCRGGTLCHPAACSR
jgi:chemotaxis protein histidine kinase CheA